jgi:hypothetical protein
MESAGIHSIAVRLAEKWASGSLALWPMRSDVGEDGFHPKRSFFCCRRRFSFWRSLFGSRGSGGLTPMRFAA